MSRTEPPITAAQMAALPAEFRALLQSVIDHYEARVAVLEARIVELEAKLEQRTPKTPQNSSLPPSTQHPHAKPPRGKAKSKRKRGGQPGHRKHARALIPVEECRESFDHRPRHCRGCGEKLKGVDPAPLRHQVWELPEITPLVSEHRLHRLTCAGCGKTTCGELPVGVPRGQAGPRLIAFVALLMGSFRLSKRKTASFLAQILHTPCSPGWVVKLQNQATASLRPSYDQLVAKLPEQGQLNIDESPHKQAKLKTWLWAFLAAQLHGLRAATLAQGRRTLRPCGRAILRRGGLRSSQNAWRLAERAMVLGASRARLSSARRQRRRPSQAIGPRCAA